MNSYTIEEQYDTLNDSDDCMNNIEHLRLRMLEEENKHLKQLLADQSLDIKLLREITSGSW